MLVSIFHDSKSINKF